MESSTSFHERTAAFFSWFRSIRGSSFHENIEIRDFRERNAGRGIVATAAIETDTVLFSIPRSAIICTSTSELALRVPSIFSDSVAVDADEDGDVEPQAHDSWTSLILVMIYEHLQGDLSRWKPYLDVLPTEFNTLMFWTPDEVGHLQASSVVPRIGKAEADNMIRVKILPVIQQHRAVFFPDGRAPLTDGELTDLAHRMGSIIMAYAFNLEKEDNEDEADNQDGWVEDKDDLIEMGMVPMADILNADAQFNAHINHHEDGLTATALRPIEAGEEILNYYGALSNGELLRRYGYTTPTHRRYDIVELSWALVLTSLKQELALSSEEMDRITQNLDPDELEDSFVLDRNLDEADSTGQVSDNDSFRGLPEELEEQVKGFLKVVRKLKPHAIPDKRKRDEVYLHVVRSAINARLSEYPTTLDDDRALVAKSSGRLRAAIEVRLGEKVLLHAARDFVTAELEEAGTSEPAPKRRRA